MHGNRGRTAEIGVEPRIPIRGSTPNSNSRFDPDFLTPIFSLKLCTSPVPGL